MFASRSSFVSNPIPLCDIESVLHWVDKFKLSRPTRKIARDFSDAVLLAEILNLHYPKLVDMHNYPPRNSQALKLNNWMTLNRKVLRKLKLQLCSETMEQLANAAPGMIERILVMVREKIWKDEEALKAQQNEDQQLSSGGSYYEACQDEENVLVVPVKSRVNGVLELIHQKVVTYNAYLSMKEELKDSKEAIEILKQKVEHLDQLMKLKEERIEELQKQLERKAVRRKESEVLLNNMSITFPDVPSISPKTSNSTIIINAASKTSFHNNPSFPKIKDEKLSEGDFILNENKSEIINIEKDEIKSNNEINEIEPNKEPKEITTKISDSKLNKDSITLIDIKSEYEIGYKTSEEDFKDSMQEVYTIEEAVIKEENEISESLSENSSIQLIE